MTEEPFGRQSENMNFIASSPGQLVIRFQRAARWFVACHWFLAVATVVVLSLVVRMLLLPLSQLADYLFGVWHPSPMTNASLGKMIIGGLILGPLLETWLGQWLIFRLAEKVGLLPQRAMPVIFVSTGLFGLMHNYSAGYIVRAFGVGFVLAGSFWLLGGKARAFKIVAGAHALLNSLAFLADVYQR